MTRAIQEVARRPELALDAITAYKRAQASQQAQPDVAQLQKQLTDLEKQEQATVKAQIAGVMAGADGSIYESMLRGITEKRNQLTTILARAGHLTERAATRREDKAAIVTQGVAAVDEVLGASNNELSPAEKQGLLSRVVEAIYPEQTPEGVEGLRIYLKPSIACNQLSEGVAYFTTYR